MIRAFFKWALHLILFCILTVLTQIGGVCYVLAHLVKWKTKKLNIFLWFTIIYTVSTLLLTPLIAPIFGREKIAKSENIQPSFFLTDLLNRNYVEPKMNQLLSNVSQRLPEGITIGYLDANFPFWDGFPLIPHLSHNDGKKLDISFIYKTPKGTFTDHQKAVSGYGVFVEPKKGEINQNEICLNKGYYQYDLAKYLSLGKINSDLQFSSKGTRILIQEILSENSLEKVFIEPHLKKRMGLFHPKIRFHGCHAVRHDDHIHIQIK